MKLRILAALAGSFASTAPAATVFSETFDVAPASAAWKLDFATVADGKLRLDGIGDETVYVNAGIETAPPRAELNFAHAQVVITLDEVELLGLAPPEKQAFVIHLGSDRTGGSRSGHVRLCVNGNGNAVLSIGVPAPDGRNQDAGLVNRPVSFPIKKIVIALDRQGYRLELTDSFTPVSVSAPWGADLDWKQWETATPYLSLKAVRRPAPGSCEVTIGALSVTSEPLGVPAAAR